MVETGEATLELFVEERVLGNNSRFFREASVRFGRPTIARVADAELPEPIQRRIDRPAWRFDMLTLPAQLEELENGQYYVDTRIRMVFDQPDVRSVYLVSPDSSDEPHVALTMSGAGLSELAWRLDGGDDDGPGIRAGGREFQAVIESPLSSGDVTGLLDARVRFVRRKGRWTRAREAEPREPLRFTMHISHGTFAFVRDQDAAVPAG